MNWAGTQFERVGRVRQFSIDFLRQASGFWGLTRPRLNNAQVLGGMGSMRNCVISPLVVKDPDAALMSFAMRADTGSAKVFSASRFGRGVGKNGVLSVV